MLARPASHSLRHKRYKVSQALYRKRHNRRPVVRQKTRKTLIYMTCKAMARPLLYA
jgi:hypothetical protein